MEKRIIDTIFDRLSAIRYVYDSITGFSIRSGIVFSIRYSSNINAHIYLGHTKYCIFFICVWVSGLGVGADTSFTRVVDKCNDRTIFPSIFGVWVCLSPRAELMLFVFVCSISKDRQQNLFFTLLTNISICPELIAINVYKYVSPIPFLAILPIFFSRCHPLNAVWTLAQSNLSVLFKWRKKQHQQQQTSSLRCCVFCAINGMRTFVIDSIYIENGVDYF